MTSDKNKLLISQDTSSATQRQQIMALIKEFGSCNTYELRAFGIFSPAPRVLELRRKGELIKTTPETVITPDGRKHPRVARYSFEIKSSGGKHD